MLPCSWHRSYLQWITFQKWRTRWILYVGPIIIKQKTQDVFVKSIKSETCQLQSKSLYSFQLDYGYALLYNIPLSLTNRLEPVHSGDARLVTSTQNWQHTAKVSFQLYWLPVSHIQSTEWTNTSVYERSDPKLNTTVSGTISKFSSPLTVTQSHKQMCREHALQLLAQSL